MKLFLLLLGCIVVSGCTKITVTRPVGTPLPEKDAKELAGTWIDSKKNLFTVSVRDGDLPFEISCQEDGKPKHYKACVTVLKSETPILWVQDDSPKAFIPFRISAGDDSIVLLYADEAEIKRLAAEGKLKGRHDKTSNSWLLETEGLEAELDTKQFWRLDVSLPFFKQSR